MDKIKKNIELTLENVARENERLCAELTDRVVLTDYSPKGRIWTDALQKALNEHEIVVIPKRDEPYLIDSSVLIPSDRHIIAEDGAVIRIDESSCLLMLRNSLTSDGTHAPITGKRNKNITIEGGLWQEWCPHRMGYGRSGMYDNNRSSFGVSTCMLFNNIDNLTLKNMTFQGCGGFAVQLGDISRVIIENIQFINCFADGLHVNGNTYEMRISNVRGEVGDDLVALNMYDWQNSSINFGPIKTVLCEDLYPLTEETGYKAMRILPGIYYFEDGSQVDCSLEDAIIKNVRGVDTFKLYFQTPPYKLGEMPEQGGVGSGKYLFFENIHMNLRQPADTFREYMTGDPVRGTFACFELGANIEHVSFENIHVNIYKEEFPRSFFLCIGPKSIVRNERELFDPYVSSRVKYIYTKNIFVNGVLVKDIRPYMHEIVFEDVNGDGFSSGQGVIGELIQI